MRVSFLILDAKSHVCAYTVRIPVENLAESMAYAGYAANQGRGRKRACKSEGNGNMRESVNGDPSPPRSRVLER